MLPIGAATGASAASMTADLGHLAHDPALTMKIMHKRREEMARRARLSNPKLRTAGPPHDVLAKQVAEKKQKEADEKAYHDSFQGDYVIRDHILQTIEGIKEEQQRMKKKETVDFSMANCLRETRREYALSDPKEYTSAYRTLPDEDLGPCSMQNFQGECVDLEKQKQQKKDTCEWLRTQMQDKLDREQAERQWNLHMDAKLLEANQLRVHCEEAGAMEDLEDKKAESAANVEIAKVHQQRRAAAVQRDREEELRHAHTVMNGDMTSEKHDYKVGLTGKITRTDYKRMTVEEEQDIYNQNAHLVREKRDRKVASKGADDGYVKNFADAALILGAVEQHVEQRKKEQLMAVVEHNKALAEAKKVEDSRARRAYLSFDYLGEA